MRDLGRPCISALALIGALLVSGCATHMSGEDSTPEQAAAAAYVHDGPPAITLYTMVSNSTGAGAHSSIMVNASQRVIFDPAGSVRFRTTPEIGDVLYGATPSAVDAYARSHARTTYHVEIMRKEVPAEVAEQALRLVQANGTAPQGFCTIDTSRILRQLPGFESIGRSIFPEGLMRDFGKLPGVTHTALYEEDGDDKSTAIAAYDALTAAQGRQ